MVDIIILNVQMSSRGINYIELSELEFMTHMLEIKDKSDTWWKLLRITMCHCGETNNRSLIPRDVY